MKRGEIWTVAGGAAYAGKPRPVVIVRDDSFTGFDSVTFVPLTSFPGELIGARIAVEPSEGNRLKHHSWLMVEKITSVPSHKLGRQVGLLGDADMARLKETLIVYLGLSR